MNTRTKVMQMYLIDKKSKAEIAKELKLDIERIEQITKYTPNPKRSKGELKMKDVLENIYPNQKILEQYYFHGMYFDFYIPHLRLVFEYDGIQHFTKNNHFHGKGIAGNYKFESGQKMDTKKVSLAKEDCIYVIRIGYKEVVTEDNIRSIINEHQKNIVQNLHEFGTE